MGPMTKKNEFIHGHVVALNSRLFFYQSWYLLRIYYFNEETRRFIGRTTPNRQRNDTQIGKKRASHSCLINGKAGPVRKGLPRSRSEWIFHKPKIEDLMWDCEDPAHRDEATKKTRASKQSNHFIIFCKSCLLHSKPRHSIPKQNKT